MTEKNTAHTTKERSCNDMKGYLGFAEGILEGSLRPTSPGGMKFMDWEKAEKICIEHPNSEIRAGLWEDWGYTSGLIYNNGKWYDGGTLYDQSRWATPIVDVDGEEIECWTLDEHNATGVPDWWGRGEVLSSEDWW